MIERAQALKALATAQLSARGYSPQEHCTPIKPEEILELIAASEKLDRLGEWTNTYGASLVPCGADTYGEGMRAAKDQVRRIIS